MSRRAASVRRDRRLRQPMPRCRRYYALERPKSVRIRTPSGVVETVEALGEALPADARTRDALTLSEQGLRESDWTAQRIFALTDVRSRYRHEPALLT
jgi:hypothetical protein